jgi:gamma-glutamyltranspeptidase/glutathione hydrolase
MSRGQIAAGHEKTAEAAELILKEGGNAFDAVVAAAFASCVAEPVFSSLGGGGFLMASHEGRSPRLFDFFVHTPLQVPDPELLEFYPIQADFGSQSQEFHIGLGSVATPGMVRGLFEINRQLGSMPMQELIAPAVQYCRDGIALNAFQQYLFEVIGPIYRSTGSARRIFCRDSNGTDLVRAGDVLTMPEFGQTLDALAEEGDDLFYRGEIAHRIATQCEAEGGTLRMEDMAAYRVVPRDPVITGYRGVRIAGNPPPSCGGILIAFALSLLEAQRDRVETTDDLVYLADVMAMTNKARADQFAMNADCHAGSRGLLDPDLLQRYRNEINGNPEALRGTTHISVIDDHGNAASMSLSNGEGCGHVVPGTGIMLNNMLGEEDLNPAGFHSWPADRRMTSMMSPSLVTLSNGALLALGSGGSNRIRTAVLQVLRNVIGHDMPLDEAVNAPRIHFERGLLNIEGGFSDRVINGLLERFPACHVWEDRNLFFGGVHAVSYHPASGFDGAGDARRSGVTIAVH